MGSVEGRWRGVEQAERRRTGGGGVEGGAQGGQRRILLGQWYQKRREMRRVRIEMDCELSGMGGWCREWLQMRMAHLREGRKSACERTELPSTS